MVSEKSKILVLVEGEKTDYKLMDRLLQMYGIGKSHEIVSYNTNIYTLYNQMFRDGDPESVDILQILKEHESDETKKKIFDCRYSDILLIFDLDPQDPAFTADKILEMVSFFVESSDMGKLYLNYPMVEAFYHMKDIPDVAYDSYIATLEELRNRKYKERVNKENRNHDYSKFATTKEECSAVIKQNIDKAWLLSETERVVDGIVKILPDAINVLKAQLKKIEEEQLVSVLCTCVFYIADYNPNLLT
ncbi:MAG: hypothetical protein IJN77_07530 [Oscillospiraceae bacterium]|nr:hypothetical protein [Oscillospiraceae bacterium]MBQ6850871.1 hypothetical protein [Oscillospiraceae bacterium]